MSEVSGKLREQVAMLSNALFPYKNTVPEDIKSNVQDLVKEMAGSENLFSSHSRRTLLYLLPFADEETRKLIFETAYLYFESHEKALTILYQDANFELESEKVQTSQTHKKSLLLAIAALDKESKARGVINLMTIVSDSSSGYIEIIDLVYKKEVSTKKRDFLDA